MKELNEVRAEFQRDMNEIKERTKKDKKYYTDKINQQ